MKTNIQATQKRKRKGFTLVELLVVIAIIASLAGLSYGPIMKHLDSAAKTEAIANGKSLHSALLGFMGQNDNSFPNDDTGLATTAEDCLQQLVDGGFVGDEKYFWNKANGKGDICSINQPDNDGTLEANENAWGFTKNLDPGSDGSAPILYDSCTSASANTASFTTLTWKGQAVIVRIDGSCKSLGIDYTGPPVGDDGAGKTGSVMEKRGSGGQQADIFAILPSYAVPLATTSGGN